ncbi:MAG: hypothetical protein HY326_06005 [Chloroflexi bacterium]|nr:hypothetical protein [Chloroflexota bacterium]
MRLIIIGCEYTGKSTLAGGIKKWLIQTMGSCNSSFHDHFLLPYKEGSAAEGERAAKQFLELESYLQECFSRYMIHYHLGQGFYSDNDHCVVDWYFADAVYADLYYKFGRTGEYADRRVMARYYDKEVMEVAPDTTLVLLKAAPEAIRQRMRPEPRPMSMLQEKDVERVLQRYQEEFDASLIRRQITLDTTNSSAAETLAEFVRLITPGLSQADRLRLLAYKALQ